MTCVISPRMDDVHKEVFLTSSGDPGLWLLLNGTVVGTCKPDTYFLINELKKKYPYLSVNIDEDQDVIVRTWECRLMRSLLVTGRSIVRWTLIEGKT